MNSTGKRFTIITKHICVVTSDPSDEETGDWFTDLVAYSEDMNNGDSLCVSTQFLKKYEKEIRAIEKVTDNDAELKAFNDLVIMELNQEFLRVRFGGRYDSVLGSQELVCRVSSTYFNWYDIIYMFVTEHKRDIKTVTVCKDFESTGIKDFYYKWKGQVMYQMLVNEFLTLPGNPVVESVNVNNDSEYAKKLMEGETYFDTFNLDSIVTVENLSYIKKHEALQQFIECVQLCEERYGTQK